MDRAILSKAQNLLSVLGLRVITPEEAVAMLAEKVRHEPPNNGVQPTSEAGRS
jgi:hypothetical protein